MNTDNWPKWANFRATDANGAVYFYERKPEAWSTLWYAEGERGQDAGAVPNWRDTLEERPKHELAAQIRREREEE